MKYLIGILISFLLGTYSWTQGMQPATIPAQRLGTPPVIDGVVNPDEWKEALRITDFWFPVRQQKGEFPTNASIGYDSKYLYVAFECEDPEPGKILAQEKKRNGAVEKDDFVALLVDPQNKRLEPYWFQVTPIGTQSESIPGGSTENIKWRGDWEAKGHYTERGWSAEMRIPIAILRYPPGQTKFGIALIRFIPRRNEVYTFPNMGSFFEETRQTEWTGLQLPVQRRPIVLLPYTLYDSQTGTDHRWYSGLDVKYTSEAGLTSLLTVKPDFRNIAADVARVDFSYTEKVLQETRPFFQEGTGFFPPRSVFYSLRVRDLNAGFKSFGTQGRWQYGLVGGEYLDRSTERQFAVGRLQYQFAPRSFVRAIGTLTRGGLTEDVWGTETSITRALPDGELSFFSGYYQDLTTTSGNHLRLNIDRKSSERKLGWQVEYNDISLNYRPRLAFVPERGYRGVTSALNYFDRPQTGPLLDWTLQLQARSRRRYGGVRLDEGVQIGYILRLKSFQSFGFYFDYLRRPPNVDRIITLTAGWNFIDPYRAGNINIEFGRQNGGDSFYALFQQSLNPLPRFRILMMADSQRIRYPASTQLPDDRIDQAIITFNYELSPERSIGGRYIYRHEPGNRAGETVNNLYFTYLQQVRKGVDLYIIYGLPNANRSQNRLAVKLVTPIEL
jgi:hypothetical protein